MGFYTRSLMDYDNEVSTVQVYASDLNAGNIAAELGLQAAFGAALNALTLGSLQVIRYGNQVDSVVGAPNDPYAQRELKWKVNFLDAVNGEKGYFTIPCADPTLLDPNNRGYADLSHVDVAQFVTDAEAYVKSRDGNAITIVDIPLVGRNT